MNGGTKMYDINDFWEKQKQAEERQKRIRDRAEMSIGPIPPSYSPGMRQNIIGSAYAFAEREESEREKADIQKKIFEEWDKKRNDDLKRFTRFKL